MTVNNKRVFYVKYLAHPIYSEILKARPDVRLDRLENESLKASSRRSSQLRMPTRSAPHATSSRRTSMSMTRSCSARRIC